MKRPENPYVVGTPIADDAKFFGRQEIIDWFVKTLDSPHVNVLVLNGQRRMGKTSVLLRLQRQLPDEGRHPVYFDLQYDGKRPLGEVLADLAEEIAQQLHLAPPQPESFDDRGRYFSDTFLPPILASLEPGERLVVLFDEFEAFDLSEEPDLPEHAATQALHPFLNRLMRGEERLAFVFAIGRDADEMSRGVRATFKSAQQRTLMPLEEKPAMDLVCQAKKAGSLRFTDDGIDRILALTGRHPYLTQLLCSSVFYLSYRDVKEGLPPPVGVYETEFSVERALETGDNALRWIWHGSKPAEKICAAALASIVQEGEAATADRVMKKIVEHAPHRYNLEILQAVSDLVLHGVLHNVQKEHYAFKFEIYRRWVENKKPLEEVDDELDQLNPKAEKHYLLGLKCLKRRTKDSLDARERLQNARESFQRALIIDPEHFNAQLALGNTLLQLGAGWQALKALEKAYDLNAKVARKDLVAALLEFAEIVHAGNKEQLTLKTTDRILELLSIEPTALRIRSEVWEARGDRVEDEEDKLKFYKKAGRLDKVREIEHRQSLRRQDFEPLTGAMRFVVSAAQEAEINCQLAGFAAADANRRAIWFGAVKLLQQEQQMLLYLAKGVDTLKRKKWPGTEIYFERVKPAHPEDESKKVHFDFQNEEESSPAGKVEAGRYRVHELAAFERMKKIADTLATSKAKAIGLARAETERRAKALWEVMLGRFEDKMVAAQSYLLGMNALREGRLGHARRSLGWGSEPQEGFTSGGGADPESLLIKTEGPIPPNRVISLEFSRDDRWLASAHRNCVRVWSSKAHVLMWKEVAQRPVEGITISPAGTTLAVLFDDSSIVLSSIDEGKVLRKVEHQSRVASIAFSPVKENLLALGTYDGSIILWDLEKNVPSTALTNGGQRADCITFSKDGELLATGNAAAVVHLWSLASGSCVHSLAGAGGAVNDVVFSDDGCALAAPFADSVVRVWDAASGQYRHELVGHQAAVQAVAFHKLGFQLASGSLDGTVRLWRSTDGELLDTIEEPDGGVTALRFRPDGKQLAWGTSNGNVRLSDPTAENPPIELEG